VKSLDSHPEGKETIFYAKFPPFYGFILNLLIQCSIDFTDDLLKVIIFARVTADYYYPG